MMLRAGKFPRGVQSHLLTTLLRDLAKLETNLGFVLKYADDDDQELYLSVLEAFRYQAERLETRRDDYADPRLDARSDPRPDAEA